MNVPGLQQARWLAQRVRGLGRPRGIILMYHRVAALDADPWYLRVRPAHFEAQMQLLRKRVHPIGLRTLSAAVQGGTLPDRAVVVTFDDGYANNLYLAKPILERYEIPATVFVTTGYVGTEKEYWWDELEQALLRPGKLPRTLQLPLDGGKQTWDLGPAAEYSQEEYRHDCAHTRDHSQRLQFYYTLWERLRPLSQEPRERLLATIRSWAGMSFVLRESHRSLTPDEVRTLGNGGLVDIGAHTVSHALLSELSTEAQHREIEQSRLYLQNLLNRDVTTFSYPFGRYTQETVSIVRNEGFLAACSITHGLVKAGADCMQLPRFSVLDWGGEEFEHHLLRWLNGTTA